MSSFSSDVGMSKESEIVCFQDLWSIAVGQSALRESELIEKELLDSVGYLKLGLDYYQDYRKDTLTSLKNYDVSDNLLNFLSKASKLLNIDAKQSLALYRNFSSSNLRGSKAKLKQMLSEEKLSHILLSEFTNYYFIERLYLLRTLGQIFGFFQDSSHVYKSVYAVVMEQLVDVIVVLEKQLKTSVSSPLKQAQTMGLDKSPEAEMLSRIVLQRIKEQCELLELIVLYYGNFEMKTEKLCFFAKLFKECEFGSHHPLQESLTSDLLTPLIECLSALQQVILIEGFDMDLLQDPEEHNLSKNKSDFHMLDMIITALVDQQSLSPLMLSWATIRYLLLERHGGLATQKMGEKAISCKVWQQFIKILNTYPFNSKSVVSNTAKKVIRNTLSRVASTFHEETLGEYGDLVSLAVLVMKDTPDSGIANNGMNALLLSATGFFPLYVDPLLCLLSSMVKTKDDAIQVHAFMANLPFFSEFLATCTRDEVESLEDASVWRLLASKPIRTAGGLHTTHLPEGTIGNLVDSQYGAMVQWRKNVNGWNVLNAELKNMLEYQGPSSNLELLGYIQKTELIYELTAIILKATRDSVTEDSAVMAVLETMGVFIAKFHRIIQRVAQSPNPPTKLVMHCLHSAIAWLQLCPELHAPAVLDQLQQIHFLPVKDNVGFSSSSMDIDNQSGIYGTRLLKCERTLGSFFVTVTTVELLIALLQYSLQQDSKIVHQLSYPVLFVLTDVLATYQQWHRTHPESWDNIGLRCLEMCHLILSCPDEYKENNNSVVDLQRAVVEILSCSNVAKIVLKLACVDVKTLHMVTANEPNSVAVLRLSDTIKMGFSLLNNLLRVEASLISRKELEERSYLHRVLATPMANDINLVSIVAGYLHHRHNIALPRLAVALLRRISLVAPMSLYACLGSDVAATRDIMLFRLRSRSEDISLKVGILEFLVVTVQYQPGLLEHFLDLRLADGENPDKGITLGDSSCLKVVLEMIDPSKQGTIYLPPRLHCACAKLLNALWVDKRHSALQALRSSSTNQGIGFWTSVLYPLFSENTPKNIAKSELLETCAHIFNIIAYDYFYSDRSKPDNALVSVLNEFKTQKRYQHWSEVLLCATKTLVTSHKNDRRRHEMFASAWKSFVITSKITDLTLVDYIVDDVCSALAYLFAVRPSKRWFEMTALAWEVLVRSAKNAPAFQALSKLVNPSIFFRIINYVENIRVCPNAVTTLNLESSLLLILVHQQSKSSASVLLDLHTYLPRIVSCVEAIHDIPEGSISCSNLLATAVQLVQSLQELPSHATEYESTLSNLTSVSCKLLGHLLRDLNSQNFNHSQLCVLLIRSLEVLNEMENENLKKVWIETISQESTLNVFGDVVVKGITSCRNNTDLLPLSAAIMRLLSGISTNERYARKIYDTGLFSVLCLSLTDVYDEATDKKWLEVYHLTLALMTHMIQSLSHGFVDNTLDFLGVHYERLLDCFSAIRWNPSSTLVQEAVISTAFLSAVTRDFAHQWRFKLPRVYTETLRHILATTHVCVAMLLQPKLLQKTAKLRHHQKLSPKTSASSVMTLSSRRSKAPEEEITDPEMCKIQERLYFVLTNCLEFIANLSPNLCQIMLDQAIDPGEYAQLLSINFTPPTLDQEPVASFGVIISAANIALSALHKLELQGDKPSTVQNTLSMLSDSALVTVMSQCMLLLKQPEISNRQKQILKRELSDELNSCVRNATRHLRHSSSSFSPHTSPIQSQAAQSSSNRLVPSTSKGVLELTTAFIKHLVC